MLNRQKSVPPILYFYLGSVAFMAVLTLPRIIGS